MPVFNNFAVARRYSPEIFSSNAFAWWTPEAPDSWTQVSLTATAWTVRLPNGNTQTFSAATTFTPPATPGGIPSGVIEAMELRDASGAVLATATGLASLGLSPEDLDYRREFAEELRPLTGHDTFIGHAGGDTFEGWTGDDRLNGAGGDDRLGDLDGNDTLSGEAGNDTLNDTRGINVFFGGDGNDVIGLFDGDASGGAGDDQIKATPFVMDHLHTLQGDAGNDTLIAYATQPPISIFGGEGDDVLSIAGFPVAAHATLSGGAGNDTAYVAYQSGVIAADRVGDVMLSTVERRIVVATADVDASALGFGVEVLGMGAQAALVDQNFQQGANNRIIGSAFADTLGGGDGEDTIRGGAGDDVLDGGAQGWGLFQFPGSKFPFFRAPSYDLADYSGAARGVTVDLTVTGAQDTGDGRDRLASFEGVIGSAFGDTLTGAAGEANFGTSSDPDRGKFSGNRIYGGDGGDRIVGGAAGDTLWGDQGTDTLIGGAQGGDSLSGGDGDDRLIGGAAADTMSGGGGGDIFESSGGDDVIDGGSSGDFVTYAGATGAVVVDLVAQAASGAAGADILRNMEHVYGSDFGDLLRGNHLSNLLVGNGGDDTIEGQAGSNYVDGGAGNDLLVLVGAVSDYFVTTPAGQPARLSGPFGVDQVQGIERVLVGGRELSWQDFTSQAFNGLRYVASNPDLIGSIGANAEAAKQHWLSTGQAQGRPLDGFDPLRYAASNLDLQAQFYIDTAALTRHYITTGFAAGRPTNTFDALQYGAANNDLLLAYGADPTALTRHYVVSGVAEHRPTTGFDALAYGAANDDLARVFGTDATGLFNHWINSGVYEGRAVGGFDPVAYLLSNADLPDLGVTVATAQNHWLNVGADQGRRGDELFGREQAGHVISQGATTTGVLKNFTTSGRPSADHDWYQVELGGFRFGGSVSVAVKGSASGGGALTSLQVDVYSAAGRLITSGTGTQAQVNLDFPASPDTSSKLFYIVVSSPTGLEGDYDLVIGSGAPPGAAANDGWIV